MATTGEILALALKYHRAGTAAQAEQLYRQVLQAEPNAAVVHCNLGALFKVQGRLDEALTCLQRAVRLQPNLASAHLNLGAVYQAQGRLDDAMVCYQQALRAAPGHADAHNNLGTVFKEQGRLDEAQTSYQEALRLKPDFAEAHYNLGALHKERCGLDDARTCFEQALRLQPDHVAVRVALADVLRDQGHLADAQARLEEALRLQPDNAAAYNQLGALLQQQDRPSEAEACYQQALRLQPGLAWGHHNLGTLRLAQGRLAEAIGCFQQAIRHQPDLALAHLSLGNVLTERGQLQEAAACYRQALLCRPDYAGAHNNLGNVLRQQRQLDEAMACYRKALQLRPDYAEAHNNLGNVLTELGQPAEAIACYRQALQCGPDYAEAHVNLGNVLCAQGQLNEAITSYRQALCIRPDYAEAHNNLGNALRKHEHPDEAITCYHQALRIQPDYAEAHNNLGNVLVDQGRMEEARVCFERAQALAPEYRLNAALLLPLVMESREAIQRDRRTLQDNITRLLAENYSLPPSHLLCAPAGPFFLAYHGQNDGEFHAQIAALYARACPTLGYVAPHCLPGWEPQPVQTQPLRVGFISKYFYNHFVTHYYAGIIRNLARDHLRVILLRFPGPDDWMARSLKESADEVVTLTPEGDLDALQRRIAAQELDVLVYTDIGLDRLTYFLAFARLAPVQCVLAGQPVTTGIPTLDYFLSSIDLEPDDADDHYTEQLVRLQHIPNFFQRPALSGSLLGRADFGLPDDARLYVCAQALYKLHPDFDDLAAGVLRADPGGRLVLLDFYNAHLTRLVIDRLRRTLGDLAGRLVVLPKQPYDRYLHLLTLADALLDSPHFSGGTTSYQALALGAPVITLPGAFSRGRQTYACYRQMAVLDCVATDPNDYVRRAVRLANDRDWRAQVRGKIQAASSVLFDKLGAVRELEAFFVQAVAKKRSEKKPRERGASS